MAISLDPNLLSGLASATSLSQIRNTSGEGALEVRGGVKTLFKKIDDFFKGLSAEGRRSLVERNDTILAKMNAELKTARDGVISLRAQNKQKDAENIQALADKLQKNIAKLTTKAKNQYPKLAADIISQKKAAPDVQSLPEEKKQALFHAWDTIAKGFPRNKWNERMDLVKSLILAPFDANIVAQKLGDRTKTMFDTEAQLSLIQGIKKVSGNNMTKLLTLLDNMLEKVRNKTFDSEKDADTLRHNIQQEATLCLTEASQTGWGDITAEDMRNTLNTSAFNFTNQVYDHIRSKIDSRNSNEIAFWNIVSYELNEAFKDTRMEAYTEQTIDRKGISDQFLKDANRVTVTMLGSQPIQEGLGNLSPAYAQQLRKELGEQHAHLLPFISYVLSQSGAQAYMTDIVEFVIPDNEKIYRHGMLDKKVSNKLRGWRQGNEFFVQYVGRQNYNALIEDDPQPMFQIQTSAIVRIQLTPLEECTRTSTSAYSGVPIPKFTVENVTMEHVMPTAENA